MAEKRRLLNEMDKCFKKVDEGFEIFDEIMAKMTEANSDNQREKFQDDLKKEIKKLQRLRDQIKGWQNSSEIKDKEKLSHYRKLIEQRMETFKDIERENKTKPHSKQGLSAEDKLDPKEKEKSDAIEWLNNQIRHIQDEIDRTESKLESMTSAAENSTSGGGGGRKGRGKKDDVKKNEKEKIEELRKHLDRVKFHLTNWEVVMRLITNERLEIKEVLTKLKEPIDMYIEALDPESELDPENLDPEDIYEELHLSSFIPQLGGFSIGSMDEDGKSIGGDNGGTHRVSPSGSPPPGGSAATPKDSTLVTQQSLDNAKQRHQSGSDAKLSHLPLSKSTTAAPLKLMRLGSRVSAESSSLSSPPPATPPPPPSIPYNTIAAGTASSATVAANTSTFGASAPAGTLGGGGSAPSSAPPITAQQQGAPLNASAPHVATLHTMTAAASTQPPMATVAAHTSTIGVTPSFGASSPADAVGGITASSSVPVTAQLEVPVSTSSPHTVSMHSMAASAQPSAASGVVNSSTIGATLPSFGASATVDAVGSGSSSAPVTASQDLPLSTSSPHAAPLHTMATPASAQPSAQATASVMMTPLATSAPAVLKTTIQPWLGASPLGMVPICGELEMQLNMLDAAMARAPVQMDSEKPRSYLPKMPCQTPTYYPQTPPLNADSLEYYLRLSPETLFFTFYYMEGSRAQLLAAKALKKLSWRFHTKFLMWFQRHEEPKQITDDFEQKFLKIKGTYVYFDFEKWAQRKKEQFTFEYKYLEDKEFD